MGSFACPLSTVEGTASGVLPLQTGTADIILGGAEQRTTDATEGEGLAVVVAMTSFVGAMEEISLSRISLENITAHLFLGNLYPMYLFDYTNPDTRKYWADSVAAIYNEAGAVCGQWDGSEYQMSVAGWGFPHSSQTWSAGTYSNEKTGVLDCEPLFSLLTYPSKETQTYSSEQVQTNCFLWRWRLPRKSPDSSGNKIPPSSFLSSVMAMDRTMVT